MSMAIVEIDKAADGLLDTAEIREKILIRCETIAWLELSIRYNPPGTTPTESFGLSIRMENGWTAALAFVTEAKARSAYAKIKGAM